MLANDVLQMNFMNCSSVFCIINCMPPCEKRENLSAGVAKVIMLINFYCSHNIYGGKFPLNNMETH